MIFSHAQDLHDAVATMPREHSKRQMLELLEKAIRRDIHFIDRHSTTLFQCMWNTCWWYDCPQAAKHYEKPAGGWRTGGPPWKRPGTRLCQLLEGWRSVKQEATPGFVWIRSVRPPEVSLGLGLVKVLRGHEVGVCSTDFSPDGQQLISGSSDGTVRLWDVETCSELWRYFGHEGPVRSVSFSPDGCRIASAGGSKQYTVRVLDRESGRELVSMRGHTTEIQCVRFSPDGTQLATCSGNRGSMSFGKDYSVRTWDVEQGTQIHRFAAEGMWGVMSVDYSPDGKEIASASFDGCLRIWNLEKRRLRAKAWGSYKDWRFTSVAYSPDGNCVAGGGNEDAEILLWDARTLEEIGRLAGHEENIRDFRFSADGSTIVSAACDGTVRTWNRASDQPEGSFRGPRTELDCLAPSPDGQHIAVASQRDPAIWIWDARYHRKVPSLRGEARDIQDIDMFGILIATGDRGRSVRFWNAADGSLLAQLELPDECTGLEFNVLGTGLMAHTLCSGHVIWEPDKEPRLRKIWHLALTKPKRGKSLFAFFDGTATCVTRAYSSRWRCRQYDGGFLVVDSKDVQSSPELCVGWFPGRLHPMVPAPLAGGISLRRSDLFVNTLSSRTWAGTQGRHLWIITLEGGDEL